MRVSPRVARVGRAGWWGARVGLQFGLVCDAGHGVIEGAGGQQQSGGAGEPCWFALFSSCESIMSPVGWGRELRQRKGNLADGNRALTESCHWRSSDFI